MTAETLRDWIRQHEVDEGDRNGIAPAAAEIRERTRRNTVPEQTIQILKAATSFFVPESHSRNCR